MSKTLLLHTLTKNNFDIAVETYKKNMFKTFYLNEMQNRVEILLTRKYLGREISCPQINS